MLLTSLALGQTVSWQLNLPSLVLWPLTIAVFVLREPLALLLRPGRSAWSRSALALWTAGLAVTIVALAALLVVMRSTDFLFLSLPASVAFGLQLAWQRTRVTRSLPAELLGTAGVALAAPAAYFAATGVLDSIGLSLWPILFTYFAAQVAYIRWQTRAAGDRRRGMLAVAVQFLAFGAFLLGSLAELLPLYSFIAFLPGLAKATLAMFTGGAKKRVTRLGWIEVAHSVLFFALAVLAFRQA